MTESPNLKLHLTAEATDKSFLTWRTEHSGPDQNSNMMILDRELGALKEWKDRRVIYSATQPQDQSEGDEWIELLSAEA